MPGVVLGEVVSTDNPLLPFFYQEAGVMTDLYALSWEMYAYRGTEVLASGSVNLTDDKVETGYYVAVMDTSNISGIEAGTHEIVWTYQATETGPTKKVSYHFELLAPGYFRTGAGYTGYAPSTGDGPLCSWKIEERQTAINRTSKEIERLTGRFFFPKYVSNRVSVTHQARILWLDTPIIGIESVILEGGHPLIGVYTTTAYDLSGIRVYNRHLGGMLSPDDRDNPRLQFVLFETQEDFEEGVVWTVGAQHLLVSGVFGYTDPDGGPFGVTPDPLREAVWSMSYKNLVDPLGQDTVLQQPGRVVSAETRDQKIRFASGGTTSASGGGGGTPMTGDPRVDALLAIYCRPFFVGVAGG